MGTGTIGYGNGQKVQFGVKLAGIFIKKVGGEARVRSVSIFMAFGLWDSVLFLSLLRGKYNFQGLKGILLRVETHGFSTRNNRFSRRQQKKLKGILKKL